MNAPSGSPTIPEHPVTRGTTLGELARTAHGTLDPGEASLDDAAKLAVYSVSVNSQAVAADGLFAAVAGTKTHGARFAAASAARAVITDPAGRDIIRGDGDQRPLIVVADVRAVLGHVSSTVYDNPSHQLTVLGVTGTAGKTTVAHMLEAGLTSAGHTVGIIGTNGTRINGVDVASELTTPEAPALQELLARMLHAGVSHVVMEVSSHALMLGRVAGTRFAVGGFTNLSQDHLDFHHTMDEYFDAKALFFDPSSPLCADSAVIVVDSSWGESMATVARGDGDHHPVTIATIIDDEDVAAGAASAGVDVGVGNVVAAGGGQQCVIALRSALIQGGSGDEDPSDSCCSWTRLAVSLSVPGVFNATNAAVAVTMATVAGVDPRAFAPGLNNTRVPGRMDPVDGGQDFVALVDYAHKPAALAAVLAAVAGSSRRIGCVIGAGGDRDHGKRPIMGKVAAEMADYVVITDDNPRSEDPATIRDEVARGCDDAQPRRAARIDIIGDRAAAIAAAVNWAEPGDTIIVAGKGHETGQKIGDKVIPFNDRQQLAAAISRRITGAEPRR